MLPDARRATFVSDCTSTWIPVMLNKAQDDDLVMNLVELALARPEEQRQAYIESSCAGDAELFNHVWSYVQAEQRMNGFLLEPLYSFADSEHPFEPGDLLDDRFRIVREVAQGGMGIVYEAMDEKLERRIALKCGKVGFRKRLPPEVRHATTISHPNVCKTFEIHTASTAQGEIDFLTMEFLDGETLTDRLRRGPLPEREARAIALQICAGLAEAHRNHVVHGDLKSSNVFLTTGPEGAIRAVITDFGLARRPEAGQRTAQSGERGGTPDYMAPELLKGEQASPASDVYALGVILYELVSGRRPHEPQESSQERFSHKPPALKPKWDRLLWKCLDPDPLNRFQNAQELAQTLSPPHSRRWFLAAAAAAVLAIVTGVVTYRSTIPRESVRLAILPFESDRDAAPVAEGLLRDTAGKLARLKGGPRTKLTVIPLSDILRKRVDTIQKARAMLGATHALHGTLESENGQVTIHVYLTDTRSGVSAKDWKVEYQPLELRYAPVALAGMVTGTLRVPPLTVDTTVSAAARHDYLSGLSYLRGDIHPDDSLTLMERAVAADPDSPLTYAGLAYAQWSKYLRTRDVVWKDKAGDSVRQAELRNPDIPEVRLIAGVLKANSSFHELAVADYQRAIELQPNNGEAYRRLSAVYSKNSQVNEALIAAQKAIQVQPGDSRNHQQLGFLSMERGQYEKAVQEFQKMVELAPNLADSHYALGVALEDVGRLAEAESELQAAIRLEDSSFAEHALGAILLDLGRNREAISSFLRARALGPETTLLWLNLGLAYGREGLARESKAAFRSGVAHGTKSLMTDPRDVRQRARVAYLLARLGDRQQAESEIAQAQVSRDDADVCLMTVLTYETLGGRRKEALDLLANSPSILIQLIRYPELADLRHDPRFQQLLSSNHVHQ
jgi:tetratricopeptide (TPR) repeat protein/TolB-like protein